MPLYAYKDTRPQIHPSAYLAPTAQVIGDVRIGRDASVWFQTVVRGDLAQISIGQRTNVQDLCVCHADEDIPLTIGDGVTIGHHCIIHGCTIEDNCLIGMGAIVMNKAVVGTGSVIAAGAVVLENSIVPAYSLVTGAPGRVKKTYENRAEIDRELGRGAAHYVETARTFASGEHFYEIRP